MIQVVPPLVVGGEVAGGAAAAAAVIAAALAAALAASIGIGVIEKIRYNTAKRGAVTGCNEATNKALSKLDAAAFHKIILRHAMPSKRRAKRIYRQTLSTRN